MPTDSWCLKSIHVHGPQKYPFKRESIEVKEGLYAKCLGLKREKKLSETQVQEGYNESNTDITPTSLGAFIDNADLQVFVAAELVAVKNYIQPYRATAETTQTKHLKKFEEK